MITGGPGSWRLYPDQKNLVRTGKVGYRKRDKRDKPEVYWKKPLTEQVVTVQRLAILQAAGEPLPTGGPEEQLSSGMELFMMFNNYMAVQEAVIRHCR